MENTLENKAKFFAQYWGQLVCKENGDHFPILLQAFHLTFNSERYYLELTPLSDITDEDAIEVCQIINVANYAFLECFYNENLQCTSVITSNKQNDTYGGVVNIFPNGFIEWDYTEKDKFDGENLRFSNAIDYLRSKGYALPWMGLSVEEQIEYGWVNLKKK